MKNETDSHYSIGHFCAGCPFGAVRHSGCTVDSRVNLLEDNLVINPALRQIASAMINALSKQTAEKNQPTYRGRI